DFGPNGKYQINNTVDLTKHIYDLRVESRKAAFTPQGKIKCTNYENPPQRRIIKLEIQHSDRIERVDALIKYAQDTFHDIQLITFSHPNELVYLDEVNEIAKIVTLPRGWQAWTPVRNVPMLWSTV